MLTSETYPETYPIVTVITAWVLYTVSLWVIVWALVTLRDANWLDRIYWANLLLLTGLALLTLYHCVFVTDPFCLLTWFSHFWLGSRVRHFYRRTILQAHAPMNSKNSERGNRSE